VDQAVVLNEMKQFFEDREDADTLKDFSQLPAKQLLQESIDVVELIVHLEDKLNIRINSNEFGPAMANMTFGELAAELCRQSTQS
jgi:acyl carrier protein